MARAAVTRPLVQQVPRRVGEEIVVAAPGDRELRLGGDADWVMGVLEVCDGRTASEAIIAALGAEADQLISALLEHGVAVDGAQAWRTFHAQSSVGSGLGTAPTEEQLAAQLQQRFSPRRLAGTSVALAPAHAGIVELAQRRNSAWAGPERRPVSWGELSAMLEGTYAGAGSSGRPVPSGGGLYPLAIHVVLRGDEPPGAGLWWLDPATRSLELVRTEDADPGSILIAHPATDPLVEAGGPVLLISADLERPSQKYGNRGYRFVLLEAGAVMQNAYLVATELGVPVRAIGGIQDDATRSFLELPAHCVPLLAIVLGA